MTNTLELSERQQRELDYHREHATENMEILAKPFSWDILQNPGRRWWNAYWQMYSYFVNCNLKGKRVLVVGCGFGSDALRLARLGATVSAFDLSPESLRIASALAAREGVTVTFEEMPAERMRHRDSCFDYIVCRDILHHVDIPQTMREIVRVAKPDAQLVVNEIYSHSLTDKVRRSWLVESFLYPRMRSLIYGPGKPYITEDERKLSEIDLVEIKKHLDAPHFERHFNCLVTRVIPDRLDFFAKMDRLLLILVGPMARLLAGRVLFAAQISK